MGDASTGSVVEMEVSMSKSKVRMIVVLVVTLFVVSACAFTLDRYALSSLYSRVPDQKISLLPHYDLFEKDYPRTDVEFQLDGYTLRGHVYGADNTRGLIIFRHGIFSKHADYLPLITAMVDKGWRIFAYDAIGCGESDGDSTLGMSQSPLDVAAAVEFVHDSGLADGMPLALWGHSWGGYGVAAALAKASDVDACVTMSGYDTPMKILDYSSTSSFGPLGKIQYPFLWLNTVIDFGDNANLSASDAIMNSGVPTLVIHGAGDGTVAYEGVSILDALQKSSQDLSEMNIQLTTLSEPGRDGHNSYFYSPESQAYLDECATALQGMLDENGDDTDAPEVQSYLASVDLKRANTADPALIDEIDSFLASVVK